MPWGGLNIQYCLFHLAQDVEIFLERSFDLHEPAGDLRPALPGEVWHFRLVSVLHTRKMDLALAHLQKILAALYEGVHLSENATLVQNPAHVRILVMQSGRLKKSITGIVSGLVEYKDD